MSVSTDQKEYRINEQARMPSDIAASVQINGIPDDEIAGLTFVWTVEIDYIPSLFDPNYGPSNDVRYLWPLQGSSGSDTFTPDFGGTVRGGTLTLTATTAIRGEIYSAQTAALILGTNPSQSVLLSYFSGSFPNSYYTLWRIAEAESNLRHFNDDGTPKWSSDHQNGVGLMQVTHPSPTADEIWSWKENADAGSRILQNDYATARSWPSAVAGTREFSSAVDAYNAAREDAGQERLARVSVPDFSTGNLLCNLLQREFDAIRLYNGAGGTDELGLPLHEYKLAYDSDQSLLDLVVDEDSVTGTAQWVRVDPSQRPQSGATDYVDRVLAAPPPARC